MPHRTYGTFSKVKNFVDRKKKNDSVKIDIENAASSNQDSIGEVIERFPLLAENIFKGLDKKGIIAILAHFHMLGVARGIFNMYLFFFSIFSGASQIEDFWNRFLRASQSPFGFSNFY